MFVLLKETRVSPTAAPDECWTARVDSATKDDIFVSDDEEGEEEEGEDEGEEGE